MNKMKDDYIVKRIDYDFGDIVTIRGEDHIVVTKNHVSFGNYTYLRVPNK